ncbi:hypothetical protein HO173_011532 [Letharia columbiana]|uniref:Uncharacterized protein n=1 Tax=Letharia columbiana TaxID=112416 RepID=A0A8H6FJ59_9LECA|nr:uncharacterized protein HO173_011532 [Letharia columbiana]KAF6229492.1 hypothetical protein HO173_011532 [Letharia columbiana]
MPSLFKIMIAVVFYLLCTVAALSPTLEPHMRDLSIGYHALITNLRHHESQTTGPYTKALLEQMVDVKTQISHMAREMGCLDEMKPALLCMVMAVEVKRLEADIVTKALEWYDFEKEKDAKAKANA